MDDRAMLLKAILACPLEDTPRLMYADSIQDENPAWAGLIRVQCAIAPMLARAPCICREMESVCPACTGDREMMAAIAREETLFRESKAWLATEWEHVYLPHRKWTAARAYPTPCAFLDRGFVDAVTCAAADWFTHGDSLRASQPISRVTLTTVPDVGRGHWRKSAPHVTRSPQFDIAGREVAMPPRPWPYKPDEPYHAGRTGRWYAGMLSLRWPGVGFKVEGVWDGPPG